MRRSLTFVCAGDTLSATLDQADGPAGLLIVSGGNEIRAGAHRGMALLAARIAAAGHPVLRFDRRGIGDSEGENDGFLSSRDDMVAAIAAFRAACPGMTRLVGFGNCDAASALLLHQPLELDALVLGNPWTIEEGGETPGDHSEAAAPALPPPSAIRARYLARLRDPASLKRLLRGDIDLGKLFRGLTKLVRPAPPAAPGTLGGQILSAIAMLTMPADILLASGDRTAQAFLEHWSRAGEPARARATLIALASTSHSFAGSDADWLKDQLLTVLRRQPL